MEMSRWHQAMMTWLDTRDGQTGNEGKRANKREMAVGNSRR